MKEENHSDFSEELPSLLCDAAKGKPEAEARLFELLYPYLRRMAAGLLADERVGHTLQPTALVHEVFLRLPQGAVRYQDVGHFLALISKAMRRILTDHARMTLSQKRGGGKKVELKDEFIYEAAHPELMLTLDAALQRLEALEPRQAKVVEMRFFAGMDEQQIANVLQVHSRTVKRDWRVARMWLYAELGSNL